MANSYFFPTQNTNSIDVTKLGNPTINPVTVAQPVIPPLTAQNTPIDASKDIKGLEAQLAELSKPTQEFSALNQRLTDIGATTNKLYDQQVEDQHRLITEQNIKGKMQALTDTTAQYNSITDKLNLNDLAFNAVPGQVNQQMIGSGGTRAGEAALIASNQAPLSQERLNLIANQLSAKANLEVARGNYTTAQDIIKQSIDAKYAPQIAKLDAQKQNIQLFTPLFNASEKRQADALQALISKQEKEFQAKKDLESNIAKISIDVAKNGTVPATITQAIGQAKTLQEAIQLASPYLKDPNELLKNDLLKEQILTSRANRQINQYEAYVKGAAAGDPTAIKALGLTQNTGETPKLNLSQKEQAQIGKDVSLDDNYKALLKAQTTINALKEYSNEVEKTGATGFTALNKNAKYGALKRNLILTSKEFFNLGVLQKIDEQALNNLFPDIAGYTTGIGRKENVLTALNTSKKQFEDKLDNDFLSVSERFSLYDKNQVPAIKNAQRSYIQAKASLNPDIHKLILDNPNMPPEDVIQIINNRL